MPDLVTRTPEQEIRWRHAVLMLCDLLELQCCGTVARPETARDKEIGLAASPTPEP